MKPRNSLAAATALCALISPAPATAAEDAFEFALVAMMPDGEAGYFAFDSIKQSAGPAGTTTGFLLVDYPARMKYREETFRSNLVELEAKCGERKIRAKRISLRADPRLLGPTVAVLNTPSEFRTPKPGTDNEAHFTALCADREVAGKLAATEQARYPKHKPIRIPRATVAGMWNAPPAPLKQQSAAFCDDPKTVDAPLLFLKMEIAKANSLGGDCAAHATIARGGEQHAQALQKTANELGPRGAGNRKAACEHALLWSRQLLQACPRAALDR